MHVTEFLEEPTLDFIRSLAEHARLSEDMIIQYKDDLNWGILIKRQEMTPKVIEHCSDCIDWNLFIKYQKVTDDVFQKFGHLFNKSNVSIFANYRPNMEIIHDKLKKFGYNIDGNYNVNTYLDVENHNEFYDFTKRHSIENYLNKYNSNLISYKKPFPNSIVLLTGINNITDVKEDYIRQDKAYVYKPIPEIF